MKNNLSKTPVLRIRPNFLFREGWLGRVGPPKLKESGYTVLEVIVLISIIAIISVLAVPSTTTLLRSYRLKSATNELASSLQLARVTAIAQNANSVVTFDAANQTYTVFSDNGAGGGTINDGSQTGTEPTVKTVNVRNDYYGQATFNAPSFGNSLYFNSQGSCSQSGSIALQNSIGGS
ncbi:MAG TPA: GspH/FimT family pseudopilin, partial [Thermodesulfobacteriota bacterium]|nr:GspH/FimT family pseudopilin [Thermodesulfobacteriota bacterium]